MAKSDSESKSMHSHKLSFFIYKNTWPFSICPPPGFMNSRSDFDYKIIPAVELTNFRKITSTDQSENAKKQHF